MGNAAEQYEINELEEQEGTPELDEGLSDEEVVEMAELAEMAAIVELGDDDESGEDGDDSEGYAVDGVIEKTEGARKLDLSREHSLNIYMDEIGAHPLLSADEELDLLRRVRYENDSAAEEKLVISNLRFVVKVAYRFRNYGFRLTDLIQEGNIGLITAIRKFDPERNLRLVTYATWWIRKEIQRYIMNNWHMVRIKANNNQQKIFYKLAHAKRQVRNLTGEENLEAVAQLLDLPLKDVELMDQRLRRVNSLNETLALTGEQIQDLLADTRQNQEEELAEKQELTLIKKEVQRAILGLKENERRVIELRILADQPLTLEEVGEEFNVTRERIRQIEKTALAKLKKKLKAFNGGRFSGGAERRSIRRGFITFPGFKGKAANDEE